MKISTQEITQTLMSDEFDTLIKSGKIYAVVLRDGTVSLQTDDMVLTNYIKVEQK